MSDKPEIDNVIALGDPSRQSGIVAQFEAYANEIATESVSRSEGSTRAGTDTESIVLEEMSRAMEVLSDLAETIIEKGSSGHPDNERAAGRKEDPGLDLMTS